MGGKRRGKGDVLDYAPLSRFIDFAPVTANASRTDSETYEFGPFRADGPQQRLARDGQPIALTPKTFQLLLVLLRHGRDLVTKDELMQAVWPNTFVEETNLTRNIFALRKALGETDEDRYIITVPGHGYRLARDVHVVDDTITAVVAATESKVQIHLEETRQNPMAWLAVAGVLLLATAAVARGFLNRPPVLTAKDTAILADFVNSTGDSVFDGTLRQGLAVQLEQSPYLSLVSDERVERALRLMNRLPDARLTAETAAELCQRTGAAAVLQGSISGIGSRFILGLRATSCRTGELLDEEQAQASGRDDVLTALTALASRFRTRVGESMATVQKYSRPLEEATTPSLEALKAYSTGWRIHAAHGAVAALPMFRRATELDPNFAMAYASLSRLYADLDQSDLAIANAKRSWELRDRASEAEKFFLTATYEMLATGNLEAAQQTCAAWAEAYPREARVHFLLAGMINKTPGRYDQALAEARKAIELDPDFWAGYYNSGVNSVYLGKVAEGESALRAARARGMDADELIMLAYDLAFLQGDTVRLQNEAALARERPGGENWMSAREASVAAYTGHLSAARILSRRAVDQALQASQPERAALWEAGAAVREALFGNATSAGEGALAALKLSHDREVEYGASFALALSGDPSGAEALADDLQRRSPDDTSVRFSYLPVLRALVALARGESERVPELLERAVPHEFGVPRSSISGLFGALYPSYVRGLGYLAAHRGSEAAAEFRKVVDHPGVVVNDPVGALARLQLGRAYALTGDKAKAQAAYKDLLDVWKNGDRDMPILRQAEDEYSRLR
jgi:DNA-binding winged helix-turn-helix (wHTH) protein/tetratricopeptide (TPR) repeat protein